MFEGYPKEVKLKDGTKIILKPMEKDDEKKLRKFFENITDEERQFFKDDVTNPGVIKTWVNELNYNKVIPILALKDDEICGDATLHREQYGWSTHVAEMRIFVDSKWQGKGLGKILAEELYFITFKTQIEKLVVRLMAEQIPAIRIFQNFGFKEEALLKDHVIDLVGNKHDLLIMALDVSEIWKNLEDAQMRFGYQMEH